MTKKYTSQDRPPWPQTHIILPLIGSSRGLGGVSFSQNSLRVERCRVCLCAEEPAPFAEPLTLPFPYTSRSLDSSVSLFAQLRISSSNKTPYADTRKHNWWQNLPKGAALTHELSLYMLPAREQHVPCSSSVSPVYQLVTSWKFSVLCVNAKRVFFQQKALSGSHCSCNQCVDNTEENLAGLQSVCNAIAPVLPSLNLLLLSSSSKSCQSRWIWIQKYLPLFLPYSLTGKSVCSSGMQDGCPGPWGRWVPGSPRGCSRFSLQGKQERAASINFLPPSPYKRACSQAEHCAFSKLCKTSRVQGAAQI